MNNPLIRLGQDAGPPQQIDAAQGWVSMRHVQRAVVFMTSNGMNHHELLSRGGLSTEQLTDVDRKVPLQAVEAILGAALERYPDPLVGLHMAGDIQPATLGALGYVLQSCATLGELVEVPSRFNGLLSNIGHTTVVRSPGLVEVRWDCLAGSEMLRRQASEYILGIFSVTGRLLAPGPHKALAVQFPHARPDQPELARAYFDFFGCPVYFDRPHASIIIPAAAMHHALPHGDAVLKDLLERHARLLLNRKEGPRSVMDEVPRLIRALLLTGAATKEAVAAQLGLSARSLHRRLDEAGTSYGEQLDSVRLAVAREQLDVIDTSIADIAERLGFSSPQAFMRWFRQQVDMTPSQYRIRLTAADPVN